MIERPGNLSLFSQPYADYAGKERGRDIKEKLGLAVKCHLSLLLREAASVCMHPVLEDFLRNFLPKRKDDEATSTRVQLDVCVCVCGRLPFYPGILAQKWS